MELEREFGGSYVLKFDSVTKVFKNGHIVNYALDKVNLTIKKGETIAIVGESGSGKTTLGMIALNLLNYDKGKLLFRNKELKKIKRKDMTEFRSKSQMIFQDPYGSLNPYNSVYQSVVAPLDNFNKRMSRKEKRQAVLSMLDRVGLRPPEAYIDEYPKKLSGGQRQRVSIARALIMRPEFIVADEPTSMLDVSVSATVLGLLNELKDEMHFSMIFITHELATAKYISDRMAVMNLGRIVEVGESSLLVEKPSHPYTKLLLNSMPESEALEDTQYEVKSSFGVINSGIKGCTFAYMCPFVKDDCRTVKPELREVGNGHLVACHYPLS